MKEHPNATITVTYWSKEEITKIEQEISQECGKSITPVAMYKATIIDDDLIIVSWINAENQILICSITKGKKRISALPIEEWNKTFMGKYAESTQQTSDGGYLLAGWTRLYDAGKSDAWLLKTDSKGNELWNKTFGGIDFDSADSVQQTSDGDFVIAGYTNSYGVGINNAWLIKTDSEGNELWNKTFGEKNFGSNAYSVRQTTDGGYILVGYISSYEMPNKTYAWLIKTDANGNQQWNKTLGEKHGYSVKQTSDRGYIILGTTLSRAWLAKTDADGNILWNNTFNAGWTNTALDFQETSDGGYILVGYISLYGTGDCYAWLLKTNSSGNEQWNKTFGGTRENTVFSVQQTSDSGYILAGETYSYGAGISNGTGLSNAWLIKTDINGNEQWNMTFGGLSRDYADFVQQTLDGGYILSGMTSSYIPYGTHNGAWLIKVSKDSVEKITMPSTSTTGQTTIPISTPIPAPASKKKSNMGLPEIASNMTYIGTKYINCHLNSDYPFQTNKKLITINGTVEVKSGSMMLPWSAAVVQDKYLFDPVTGNLISNFDEMIGKVVTIKGYSGIGQITMYTPYIPGQTNTTISFNNSFYVSEIIGWRNICCDATLEDTGIISTPNVCYWFEK
ncbi:Uncharacterised protein [uncultured archaeon]|nr:Uncharacterised protein [uncultured archaeon]